MTTRLRVLMVSGTFLLATSLWAQTAQVNSRETLIKFSLSTASIDKVVPA